MPVQRSPGRRARRHGGFFSSARVFALEPGEHVDSNGVRGYHIDLRVKAVAPQWPPPWIGKARLWVAFTQWGLGCFERYVAGEGEEWLGSARATGDHLAAAQERGGRLDGGFVHRHPYPHTFRLEPPWLSGIVQGQAASLFTRLHAETGEERFADAAGRALRPLDVPSRDGGVQAFLDGGAFPEEYPTDPASYVLNGGIFALFGLHDVGAGLDDGETRTRFDAAVDVLARNLHRWDAGHWSRYDLYPHPVPNVASSAYHHLHISQLDALTRLSPRPELAEYRDRFRRYEASRLAAAAAFARKALFRTIVRRGGRKRAAKRQ